MSFTIANGTGRLTALLPRVDIERGLRVDNKDELLGQLRIDRDQHAEFPARLVLGLMAGLALVGLLILILWLWSRPAAIPVSVDMARVSQLQTIPDSVLDASGYVTARRRATVSSKVTGKVVEVLIEEGMFVEQGQIVARLDDSNLRKELQLGQSQALAADTRVEEARARLVEAELTLKRKLELRDRGLISQAEMDAAQAAFQALRAQLKTREAESLTAARNVAMLQQHMDDLVLTAPFSGVVVAKNAQPGEMISPVSAGGGFTRTGICSLVDMSSLEIEVDVNEAYIERVKPEQKVKAVLDAYPDWEIPAKVIAIIPTADRQKATVRVRIGFDQLDTRILPDMGVKVSFLKSQADKPETAGHTQGIMVPVKSIVKINDESFIYIVENEAALQRKVMTGSRSNGKLQVLSGLTPGENYIVDVPDALENGSRVAVN